MWGWTKNGSGINVMICLCADKPEANLTPLTAVGPRLERVCRPAVDAPPLEGSSHLSRSLHCGRLSFKASACTDRGKTIRPCGDLPLVSPGLHNPVERNERSVIQACMRWENSGGLQKVYCAKDKNASNNLERMLRLGRYPRPSPQLKGDQYGC